MNERHVFDRRWMMYDFARQRYFVKEEFLLLLDTLQRLNYNGLCLYLEGAFAFPSMPGMIRKGALTPEDAAWIVEEASKRDIAICPITNVVGHMEHFFEQERNRSLMSSESPRQIDFLDPRAESFALNIVDEYLAAFQTPLLCVGGDEVVLTPETKVLYAKFVAKICRYLQAKGVQPAIFADMIWMDQELTEEFDRHTLLFDWNYYGHRPESVAFFKEKGFTDIVVCTCDNSWEGIINYQRTSGHLRAHTDIPVQPDEIEAFYQDALAEGCLSAMYCNWGNEEARPPMWSNLVPMARTSLFLTGQIEAKERCDEKIEELLFGRVTPYTNCTYRFQNEVQRLSDIPLGWFQDMRRSLFTPSALRRQLINAQKELPDFTVSLDAPLRSIEKDLLEWFPASSLEEKGRTALMANAAMTRAGAAIIDAGCSYTCYQQAARLQFSAPSVASQLVLQVKNAFLLAASQVRAFSDVFAAAISGTGHTKDDLARLAKTASLLEECADRFAQVEEDLDRIPLPRFELLLDQVLPKN